ncbi:hypothetical protein CDL12_08014 [Handroanthus impetiginosus]|uniref:25S rRNA (uridine-N(3))-methyltransferase BMT5-like domain-containing protein n=1 Tax=Handroanthus impetiginosus TaxID=429701 RepID=A0A2G9HP48_9LAMI|nr:hypothetical protein CDL12_08014 [Handroanthus impetiginosus]
MGILHNISKFLGYKTEVEEDLKRPFYYQKQNLEPCHGGNFSRSSDKSTLKILNFHCLFFRAIKGLLQKVRLIFYLSRPSTRVGPVLPVRTLSTSDDDPSLFQPLIISDSSSEIGSLADSENNVDAISWENNSTNREEMDRVIISIPGFANSEYTVDAVSCEDNSTNRKEMDCAIISIPKFADSENNDDAVSCESNCTSRKEIDCAIISIPDSPDSENYVGAVSFESNSTNRKEMNCSIISIPDSIDSENNVDDVSFESNSTNRKEMDCAIISIPDFADSENNVDVLSWESNPTNRKEMDCVIISIPEYLRHSLACTSVNQEIVDSTIVTDQECLGMGRGRQRRQRQGRRQAKSKKEKVITKSKVAVVKEEHTVGIKWIKHYGSHHHILLVGEGDFSFSACLAVAFDWAANIIATSLDSKEFLKENYKNAMSNIQKLRSRGSQVMHGIDATKIADHPLLGHLKFDRIVYNFPFAGFFKELSRKNELRRHRRLVSLFLKNAKEITSENGEIHITHKTNNFHNEWNLESVASSHGLMLIEAIKFERNDYPGYNTKYGFGGDNNFNCNPAETYKFRLKRLFY